ncbi:MAG: isopenicillin N synthase family dioxygenase [Candidatus Dormibacteria bacterium]
MKKQVVPVIDLSPVVLGGAESEITLVAARLGEAFKNSGFAVIVNCGVSERVINDTYQIVNKFFHLPTYAKLNHMVSAKVKTRGYLPIGIESVAATMDGETPPDICEALVFSIKNKYQPDFNIYPLDMKYCVTRYGESMRFLGMRLLMLITIALDLPKTFFTKAFDEPRLTLRFVNYPDMGEHTPEINQLRYGAHNDYGVITVVRQDDAPGGLEICDKEGNWQAVPNLANGIVVNVGDLLSRWTNGIWRSTLHRVSNPPNSFIGSTQRLSLVAFFDPNENTVISCLPSCHSSERPPLYDAVKAGDYIDRKLFESMNINSKLHKKIE